jgi:hypothetical protein
MNHRISACFLITLYGGAASAIECALSLTNGLHISSSKQDITKLLGKPIEEHFDPHGAYDYGLSYKGISFDFMDESLMVVSITSADFPLANGVHVGMAVADPSQNQESHTDRRDTMCWCRFGVEEKKISTIELLCPL